MFTRLAIPGRPAQSAAPTQSAPPQSTGRGTLQGASQDASPAPSSPLPAAQGAAIAQLRERIARIERGHGSGAPAQSLPLGIPAIDQALPGGGIALGALHEAASAGADTEHAAAATLFVAGLLARLDGPVLWVLRQADLFAPGLACAGLQPDRVIFVEAGKAVLAVMEEGLRHAGLAGWAVDRCVRFGASAWRGGAAAAGPGRAAGGAGAAGAGGSGRYAGSGACGGAVWARGCGAGRDAAGCRNAGGSAAGGVAAAGCGGGGTAADGV